MATLARTDFHIPLIKASTRFESVPIPSEYSHHQLPNKVTACGSVNAYKRQQFIRKLQSLRQERAEGTGKRKRCVTAMRARSPEEYQRSLTPSAPPSKS